MKIFEILRNPIVKVVGIAAVLYFGLFSNKDNPESLGNRLSPDQIKKNLSEVQDKGRFIVTNVQMAQTQPGLMQNSSGLANVSETQTLIEEGEGEEKVGCGDIAEISYSVYTGDGRQVRIINSYILNIGSMDDFLLEKHAINMRKKEIKRIDVPKNFVSGDNKLKELMRFSDGAISYQVTLISIMKNPNNKLICNYGEAK